MMEKLVAMKNSKKGFTLVELIVVLVILAILAAILIPTLTKYIDKANNNALVAETRSVVMAAQTLASEAYGTKNSDKLTESEVAALAEVDETKIVEIRYNSDKKIVYAAYGTENVTGKVCYYTPDNGYTMTAPVGYIDLGETFTETSTTPPESGENDG